MLQSFLSQNVEPLPTGNQAAVNAIEADRRTRHAPGSKPGQSDIDSEAMGDSDVEMNDVNKKAQAELRRSRRLLNAKNSSPVVPRLREKATVPNPENKVDTRPYTSAGVPDATLSPRDKRAAERDRRSSSAAAAASPSAKSKNGGRKAAEGQKQSQPSKALILASEDEKSLVGPVRPKPRFNLRVPLPDILRPLYLPPNLALVGPGRGPDRMQSVAVVRRQGAGSFYPDGDDGGDDDDGDGDGGDGPPPGGGPPDGPPPGGDIVPYMPDRQVVLLPQAGRYRQVDPMIFQGPSKRMINVFKERDLDEYRIAGKNESYAQRVRRFVSEIPSWEREERLLKNAFVDTVFGQDGKSYRAPVPTLHREHVEAVLAETLIQLLKGWLLGDPWDPLLLLEVVLGVLKHSRAAEALLNTNSVFVRAPYANARYDMVRGDASALLIIVNMLVPISGAYEHALDSTHGDAKAQQAISDCMFAFIDAVFCRLECGVLDQMDEIEPGLFLSYQTGNKELPLTKTKNHIVSHYFGNVTYDAYRAAKLAEWTNPPLAANDVIDDDTLVTYFFTHELFQSRRQGAPVALYATSVWAMQRAALFFDQIETPEADNNKGTSLEFLGSFHIDHDAAQAAGEHKERPAGLLEALKSTGALLPHLRSVEEPGKTDYVLNAGRRLSSPDEYLSEVRGIINWVGTQKNSCLGMPTSVAPGVGDGGARALHRLLSKMRVGRK